MAGISSLAARKQAVVHFPWPLSPLMRHVVRHLPAAAYDALVGRMAGRGAEGATREGDGRG